VEKFNISFRGEILPGHDPETAKNRFAQLFSIDDAQQVNAIFSGKEIVLRRNLDKKDAAMLFKALRDFGVVTHVKKQKTGKAALKPAARIATKPRRKRQPGEPNVFDLRLSDRAAAGVEKTHLRRNIATAPTVAAAIALLAFLLVGLRFWSDSRIEPASGLGLIAIDPRQQPVVLVGDQLLFHDRAGIATDSVALGSFGVSSTAAFDFFSNGDLLILQQEAPTTVPERLHPWLGIEPDPDPGASLLRCKLDNQGCEELLAGLGPVSFVVDRRTDQFYLAEAQSNRVAKYSGEGEVIVSHAIELSAPLHLRLQEGIMYLTQAGSDSVLVLKPDDRDFGQQLDKISLEVEAASLSGHIFPAGIAWLNQHWWTIMQSRDGSTAGLYLFGPRWKFDRSIELPQAAHPSSITRWNTKMLVADDRGEVIYRFDATGRAEKHFTSTSITSSLDQRQSRLSFSRGLQALILLVLFVAAAGLMALGVLQSLRSKVYIPPPDRDEPGFDINNEAIEWLAPATDTAERLRHFGNRIAGTAAVLLIGAFAAQLNIWIMIAICILLAGLGGFYFALQKSIHCHLGVLGNKLILVDHTNTYRVGSGPKIQYLQNYVMIDDVIVFLGNPLLDPFETKPLQEKFRPVMANGIKVDRATLRVKMVQNLHPMAAGVCGVMLASACALLLVFLS
jgi:hypothetical protein